MFILNSDAPVRFLIDNSIFLIESVQLYILADMFLHRKSKGILPLLPPIVIIWLLQLLIRQSSMGSVKIIVSLLIDIVSLLIYYRTDWSLHSGLKKLFLLAIFYFLMTASQSMSIAIFWGATNQVVYETSNLRANPSMELEAYVVSLLVNFVFIIIFERFRIVKPVTLSTKNWLILLSMPVCSITVIWIAFPYNKRDIDQETLIILLVFSAIMLCFNLFVFFVYRIIASSTIIACRYNDLKQYCKHLDGLLRSEKKQRDTIHDYLHNLGVIATILEENRPQAAADYIYRLDNKIRKAHVKKYTGNWEVDAILSNKMTIIESENIACSIEGILPSKMPFEFLDICSLLSNALDNAVEACISAKPQINPGIKICVDYDSSFFRMYITNSVGQGNKHKSNKDPANHGRGLSIMNEVAEKYEGILRFDIIDGCFRLSVLMQNPNLGTAKE